MNDEALPKFRYHPDPVRSGVVRLGPETCKCCNRARGYIYSGPAYSEGDDLEDCLCPWCIADGTAAEKLGASFVDTWALDAAGIAQHTISEVGLRTPGYVSWQSEEWLSHCNDACAFYGDMAREELESIPPAVSAVVMNAHGISESDWSGLVKHYEPGGDPAFYKFVCLHCGAVLLGMDYS